jgi:glycosyltransferase involved in cell wall biosynthesis
MQSGAYRAAIRLYEALLEERPDDADVLNDAALAYAQEKDWQKAETYLRRALDNRPDFEAAFYNLLDVLIEARKDLDAREVFESYGDDIPNSADKSTYRERLDQTPPAYQGDGAPTAQRDTDTLRIAFVCGPDRKFITDIEREIGKRHEVRTAYFDDKVNLPQIQRVMDWADVTWFEWCDKILAHASHKLRRTSRVVCRLHRYEAFTDVPQKVNWSFVDTLIPTTHHIQKVLDKYAPSVTEQTDIQVISSTVDISCYSFKERESGYNLAYLGYLHHRKNPSLLLQCMHALVQKNDQYHLHVGGYFQQPVWEYYFEHMLDELALRDHVTLHGWVDDVKTWLDDKHYLVLPAIHEGNPYSVLEAAARGVRPLIHNFAGSRELYPASWTFNTPSEFVDHVVNGSYIPDAYRSYVASHYSLKDKVEEIDQLLSALASRPGAYSTHDTPSSERDSVNIMEVAEDFYDQWTTRMIGDYVRGNPRVVDATLYALNRIPLSAERILDLGCGMGWSTNEIKRQFDCAHAVGVDLSTSLIDTANKLFGDNKRISFFSGDITKHILDHMEPFNAVVMMDVYEHIPRPSRSELHRKLSGLLAESACIVLSCPTPKLQRYLMENDPEKLQPVDEIVELEDLEMMANDVNGSLVDYNPISIWNHHDYFHATIKRGDDTHLSSRNVAESSLESQASRIRRVQNRLSIRITRK